jgi:tRNA pseudouridine38-40 synthase
MMQRYFLEVCYRGQGYAGFQAQRNGRTIQGEVERAMAIYLRDAVSLTGSSRTDSGVHARQNYFHFDYDGDINESSIYNFNAILPADIAVRRLIKVDGRAHCRFDAVFRRYSYLVYNAKDPFLSDYGYYYPYRVNVDSMKEAAAQVLGFRNFEAFSKRNTQVKTFECTVFESSWETGEGYLRYGVKANRFLRGMVRGLVGTMLQVGRGKIDVPQFRGIIEAGDSGAVDFAVPGHGLCLEEVGYPKGYFVLDEG